MTEKMRFLDLPFTPKARRVLRRVEGKRQAEYTVRNTQGHSMTVTACEGGDAKRKANSQWRERFGYAAKFTELRVSKLRNL